VHIKAKGADVMHQGVELVGAQRQKFCAVEDRWNEEAVCEGNTMQGGEGVLGHAVDLGAEFLQHHFKR
jgi:hypothetical protein